jgi:hypothetical protein
MFGLRREINGRLERIAAGIATPKMPNTSLLHVLGPSRSKQCVTALRTLIENSFGCRRLRFTSLHDDTSLFSFLRTENLASLCDSKNTIIESSACRDLYCEQLVVSQQTFFGYLSQVRNESAANLQILWISGDDQQRACESRRSAKEFGWFSKHPRTVRSPESGTLTARQARLLPVRTERTV